MKHLRLFDHYFYKETFENDPTVEYIGAVRDHLDLYYIPSNEFFKKNTDLFKNALDEDRIWRDFTRGGVRFYMLIDHSADRPRDYILFRTKQVINKPMDFEEKHIIDAYDRNDQNVTAYIKSAEQVKGGRTNEELYYMKPVEQLGDILRYFNEIKVSDPKNADIIDKVHRMIYK